MLQLHLPLFGDATTLTRVALHWEAETHPLHPGLNQGVTLLELCALCTFKTNPQKQIRVQSFRALLYLGIFKSRVPHNGCVAFQKTERRHSWLERMSVSISKAAKGETRSGADASTAKTIVPLCATRTPPNDVVLISVAT